MKNSMETNFKFLEDRVLWSLEHTDLKKVNDVLRSINEPTLVSGVGGSSVVSEYASKVLNNVNGIITRNIEPYDVSSINLRGYKNILSCSYSGDNYGVELTFDNELNHYLLSSKESEKEGIININYSDYEKDKSFISLAATLIPCAILFNYYADLKMFGDGKSIVSRSLVEDDDYFDFDTDCEEYEIFMDINSSTPAKFLESTMVEAGLSNPIIHNKYSYCHGRSTLCKNKNAIAIFFNTNTHLDRYLLEEIRNANCYKDVIEINHQNNLASEFQLLLASMYLTKHIAKSQNKDLSKVEYNPIVKKLYKYNGSL